MELDRNKIINDLDIYRNRFYPDIFVLENSFRNIPPAYRPVINVYCANYGEYIIAQALAPTDFIVHFIMPDEIDLGLEKQKVKRKYEKKENRKIDIASSVIEKIVEGTAVTIGLGGIYYSLSTIASKDLSIGSIFAGIGGILLTGEVIIGKLYERYKK